MAKESPAFVLITMGRKGEKFENEYAPKLYEAMRGQGAIKIEKPETGVVVPLKAWQAFEESHPSQIRSLLTRGNIDVRTIDADEYTKLTGRSTKSQKEQEKDWDVRLGKGGGPMDADAVYAELRGQSGLRKESQREWINWTRDNAKPLTYAAVIIGAIAGLAYLAKMTVDKANDLGKAREAQQQQMEH